MSHSDGKLRLIDQLLQLLLPQAISHAFGADSIRISPLMLPPSQP